MENQRARPVGRVASAHEQLMAKTWERAGRRMDRVLADEPEPIAGLIRDFITTQSSLFTGKAYLAGIEVLLRF